MTREPLDLRFLSEEDLISAGVLEMGECVETIEEVFALVERGDYLMGGPSNNDHGMMMWFPTNPKFEGMPAAGPDRRFMSMMAYLGGDFQVVGEKWYGSNIANRERDLPRSIHTVTLNDVETGAPIAFMSGNLISAMRTGAVCGVAIRHLSAPGARSAAIIGAGVISTACARAILHAAPKIERLTVLDINPERAAQFVQEIEAEFDIQVSTANSLEEAVRSADVISVATSGPNAPRIAPEWIKPTAVLALTGNTSMPAQFYQDSRIVVDNWAMHKALYQDALAHPDGLESITSWAMSADLLRLVDQDQIFENQITNLGAHIAPRPAQGEATCPTVFISGGMPVEDVAWAYRVYQNAKKRDIGQKLRLWEAPHWA